MKRIPAPPAPELTPDEQRVLASFRTMDQRSRDRYIILMQASAENFPRRAVPLLRLVTGGEV
jgi:hypothetical protein